MDVKLLSCNPSIYLHVYTIYEICEFHLHSCGLEHICFDGWANKNLFHVTSTIILYVGWRCGQTRQRNIIGTGKTALLYPQKLRKMNIHICASWERPHSKPFIRNVGFFFLMKYVALHTLVFFFCWVSALPVKPFFLSAGWQLGRAAQRGVIRWELSRVKAFWRKSCWLILWLLCWFMEFIRTLYSAQAASSAWCCWITRRYISQPANCFL